MRRLLALLAAALLGAAPAPDAPAPDALDGAASLPERLSADARVLASDAFEGRAPGTPGEARTVAWLVRQFAAIRLKPGGPGGQWCSPCRSSTRAWAPA